LKYFYILNSKNIFLKASPLHLTGKALFLLLHIIILSAFLSGQTLLPAMPASSILLLKKSYTYFFRA